MENTTPHIKNIECEILEKSEHALKKQNKNGSFPKTDINHPGVNTKLVTSTSCWLLTLIKAYRISKEKRFFDSANRAADYLISSEARPYGGTFYARNLSGKDKCDGLVGQAGPIRAIKEAAQVLDRDDLFEIATNIFILHPFDKEIGLWKRVEIDGEVLSFDRTLNHQLKFAATGATFRDNEVINDHIDIFVTKIDKNIQIDKRDCIVHYISPPTRSVINIKNIYKNPELIFNTFSLLYNNIMGGLKNKEIGYFPHNMRHLSFIYESSQNHSFWRSKKFKKVCKFMMHDVCEMNSSHTNEGSDFPRLYYIISLLTFKNLEFIRNKYNINNIIKGLLKDQLVDFSEMQKYRPGYMKTLSDIHTLLNQL